MLYISYYSKLAKLRDKGLKGEWRIVAISNSVPAPFKNEIPKLKQVIPSWSLVDASKKGKITREQFDTYYKAELINSVRANKDLWIKIYEHLSVYENDPNNHVVFLCYEHDNATCHRRVFANFIYEYMNIKITEL